jgi:hypothetical protein
VAVAVAAAAAVAVAAAAAVVVGVVGVVGVVLVVVAIQINNYVTTILYYCHHSCRDAEDHENAGSTGIRLR